MAADEALPLFHSHGYELGIQHIPFFVNSEEEFHVFLDHLDGPYYELPLDVRITMAVRAGLGNLWSNLNLIRFAIYHNSIPSAAVKFDIYDGFPLVNLTAFKIGFTVGSRGTLEWSQGSLERLSGRASK